MTRALLLRPEAEVDLAKAYDWYEKQVPHLGSRFLAAVDTALAAITETPHHFPVLHKNLRRALLRQFPYQIFFLLRDEDVVVIAVLHVRRNPNRWMKRASE